MNQKIKEIHPQVIQNFRGREVLSIIGFMLVAVCPILFKKPINLANNQIT
jgi:hypothetical protein